MYYAETAMSCMVLLREELSDTVELLLSANSFSKVRASRGLNLKSQNQAAETRKYVCDHLDSTKPCALRAGCHMDSYEFIQIQKPLSLLGHKQGDVKMGSLVVISSRCRGATKLNFVSVRTTKGSSSSMPARWHFFSGCCTKVKEAKCVYLINCASLWGLTTAPPSLVSSLPLKCRRTAIAMGKRGRRRGKRRGRGTGRRKKGVIWLPGRVAECF
jgi:hypothetical protein